MQKIQTIYSIVAQDKVAPTEDCLNIEIFSKGSLKYASARNQNNNTSSYIFLLNFQYCREIGGTLGEMKDSTEAKTVQTYLNTVADQQNQNWYWLGLTDVQTEGLFVWSLSQTNVTWTYWRSGEPNGGRAENCVAACQFTERTWIDISCSWSVFALCQSCKHFYFILIYI